MKCKTKQDQLLFDMFGICLCGTTFKGMLSCKYNFLETAMRFPITLFAGKAEQTENK